MDIAITIPQETEWSEYEKELAAAKNGDIMNFKVKVFPKNANIGDRCYVVYRGFVRGWMTITGMSEKSFTCTTTGRQWSGRFVERSGEFHKTLMLPMSGFRGFKYVSREDLGGD